MKFAPVLLLATLLTAFTTFAEPSSSLAPDSRCFEMRTYHAAPGKLEELHARFRNHTNKLFEKHGMKLIGFWVPMDKNKHYENTLVYILAFPSREAHDKMWKEFANDPEWIKARNESEKNGKLVEKVDSVFMTATDYSAIK
jgi:NDP-sugar pyrophosphorylase family protein